MNHIQLLIIAIASLTSCACIIPGTFLMLRGIALLSDAISHSILPGIVIMFLLVGNLASPLLLVGAACAGILTVLLTEALIQTKRVKKDAAIGLVFPLFFSIGVLLISVYARSVHLDMDMVLLGELAFTPFNHCIVAGFDIGPCALWIMASIALINCVFLLVLYKELTVTTFDATLSQILGFTPLLIYYGLVTITSITAVGTLMTVGSTVAVALMLVPPATAYLLTDRLKPLLYMSMLFGLATTIGGYALATLCNVSIAGSMACMSGLLFGCVFICAPIKGLYAQYLIRQKNYEHVSVILLCSYLMHQQGPRDARLISCDLGWSYEQTICTIHQALLEGYVLDHAGNYAVVPSAYSHIQQSTLHILSHLER